MATHFNILAWRIPWTEEPEELQSMGHKESDTTEHLCIAQQHTYHYIIYNNFFFYLPIMDIWVITHLESFQIRLYGHLCTSLLWTLFHFSHFFSFISLLGSRMARSFDRWIFNFLREYETIFPSSCTWLSWLLYLYNVLKSEKVLQLLFFKLALVILCLYILIYFLE